MPNPDSYIYPSDECRRRFGRVLKAWQLRNRWTHATVAEWGKEAGFNGGNNATFNELTNAKKIQPAIVTFAALGAANKRVALGDYSGVATRALRDRLEGSMPLVDEEGKPWGAVEFFGFFVGEKGPPMGYSSTCLTDEDLGALSAKQAARFRNIAQVSGLTPKDVWDELCKLQDGLNDKQLEKFRSVLSEWEAWSADEWEHLEGLTQNPVEEVLQALENRLL